MSFLKKFFGTKAEVEGEKEKSKKASPISLKERDKIQILQTISGKNYKVIRIDEAVGDCIDHYQYYDDNGRSIEDFPLVLWVFENMLNSNLVDVKDFK